MLMHLKRREEQEAKKQKKAADIAAKAELTRIKDQVRQMGEKRLKKLKIQKSNLESKVF